MNQKRRNHTSTCLDSKQKQPVGDCTSTAGIIAVVAAAACCYCCYCVNESAAPKTERRMNKKKRGGRGYKKAGWIGPICKDRWDINMKTKRSLLFRRIMVYVSFSVAVG